MDSITQIILGAAVGEIALGKKIGNRALIWGGIGGTIPDLDVIANGFMSSIEALAFHRSISHSIFFSITASALFGWLVYQLYEKKIHKSLSYKIFISLINLALLIGITWGINYLFRQDGHIRWWLLILTSAAALYLIWRLYKFYLIKDLEEPKVTFRGWYWLFFLAFFTHLALDCFTAFGTQIFVPFSRFRVAFNNIAVADPAYTIPFLICVIIVSCLKRNTRARKIANWTGIGISSLYMLWTIVNKVYVDHVFQKALDHRNIEATRCQTSPTIFNNFLWSCVAEDKDKFYVGQYSLFDSDPNLHYLNEFPKNDSIDHLLSGYKDYKTLLWFSKGYLTSFPTDSLIILTDLRYGGMFDTIRGPQDLIFKFKAIPKNGSYEFTEFREPLQGDFNEMLMKFFIRIKGY